MVLLIIMIIFKKCIQYLCQGESILTLSHLFHCSFTLTVKNVHLISNLNLFSFLISKSAQISCLWSPFVAQVSTYRL